MTGPDEILLARHGETDDNARRRFQGRADTALNERGRRQSRALAERLRGEGLRALYTSPLRRAHETAVIVGAALGLEPIVDERLVEADTGAWSGLPIADVVAAHPDEYARWRDSDPSFRFPDGESVAEQVARVAAALDAVAAGPLPAVVVAHGGSIRCVAGVQRPADGAVGNCAVLRLTAASLAGARP